MKLLFFLLLCFCPIVNFAQTLPRNGEGKYTFSEVVHVKGTQQELYKRALNALTPTANEIIRKEHNSITWQDSKVLMVTTPNIRIPVSLLYEVTLQQKDGRYLYIITNLLLEDKKTKGFVAAENFEALQPLSKDLYTTNNTLKPKGQALHNLQQAYLSEIEKTIGSEINRIQQIMVSPVSDDW